MPSSSTPSAKQIADRLQTVSAVELQVFAEQLAQVLFPEKFGTVPLVIRGRNKNNQTTKGWPDAYVEAGNNQVHAIEATRQSNWEKHVSDDYQKAADSKNRDLASYFFVGVGDPGERVDAAKKAIWIEKFCALGLKSDNVHILVGLDLVTALQERRCSRLCLTYLNLQISPRVFSLLIPGEMPSLSSSVYQPNLDDFAAKRVFAPEIVPQVLEKLSQTGRALVKGHGAAGKTTLVQVLASLSSQPYYYMDLAALTNIDLITNEVRGDLVEFGGAGTTFVLDNIHLHEVVARSIANIWRDLAEVERPKLLLLGREQKDLGGSSFGTIEPIVLRAKEAALKGVLARLLGRIDANVPSIPSRQMDQWIETFGGNPEDPQTSVDLIAFSAAVERRLNSISCGQLTLTAEDAVDGVRKHYWQPVMNTPEAENLHRLAALAQIEIDATDEFIARIDVGFTQSATSGLVVTGTSGGETRKRYKLAHPALAQLLLSAVGCIDGGRKERLAAAGNSTPLAFRLSRVAPSSIERSEALKIGMASIRSGTWIDTCANLDELCAVLSALPKLDESDRKRIDETLSERSGLLRLTQATRHVSNWVRALTVLDERLLSQTLCEIRDLTIHQIQNGRPPDFFYSYPAHEVAALMRKHPASKEILSSIDEKHWRDAQILYARATFVSETVSAASWLASNGGENLARPPCDRQIADADPSRWCDTGISHLSHLVRLSSGDSGGIRGLLEALEDNQWLQSEVANASTGDLSGALFSLGNHLPENCLPDLFLVALEARVTSELQNHLLAGGELTTRALSLLGSASSFLPQYTIPADLILPSDEQIAAMIRARVRKVEVNQIGTHELQLWLGIMKLSERKTIQLDGAQVARVRRLLSSTATPSMQAESTKAALLLWLQNQGGK